MCFKSSEVKPHGIGSVDNILSKSNENLHVRSTENDGLDQERKHYPHASPDTSALAFSRNAPSSCGHECHKVDDASISTQVKTILLLHLSMNFYITVKGGVVTLSGSATDLAEKNRNTELVAKITGVKSVLNNMVTPETVARNN